MRALLKIILALRGCRHRWEVNGRTYRKSLWLGREEEHSTGIILRCRKCGDYATRRLAE